ncbi:hypothetical protein FB451DRAFT_111226 [Mycena latifolia]|nr:hypothetical protein FB451DRAFT_111226 [Mycena latifolia]
MVEEIGQESRRMRRKVAEPNVELATWFRSNFIRHKSSCTATHPLLDCRLHAWDCAPSANYTRSIDNCSLLGLQFFSFNSPSLLVIVGRTFNSAATNTKRSAFKSFKAFRCLPSGFGRSTSWCWHTRWFRPARFQLTSLPSSLSVRAQTANSTVATDFVHSWGPSVLLDWVDHVAYPNTNHSKQELCRKIGLQLEPLTFSGFWKDVGGSAKTIAGVTPWIAEAAVKYSRGEQT